MLCVCVFCGFNFFYTYFHSFNTVYLHKLNTNMYKYWMKRELYRRCFELYVWLSVSMREWLCVCTINAINE